METCEHDPVCVKQRGPGAPLVFSERELARDVAENYGRRIEQPDLSPSLASGGGSHEEKKPIEQPTQELGSAPISESLLPAPLEASRKAVLEPSHLRQRVDLQVSDRSKERCDERIKHGSKSRARPGTTWRCQQKSRHAPLL
jgi:hypothetical protein